MAPGRQALLAQAAPYREEGLRPPRRGGGVRGLLLDGPKVREAQARGARRRARRPRGAGFLLLDWLPGECQVDFGQADFRVRGVVTRAISSWSRSPTPTSGSPRFLGRDRGVRLPGAQERVEFVGGVPLRAVFDNATEVGRRVGARSPPPRSSAASPRTTGSTTASPTPTPGTRRAPWRTRWGRSGGTSSCRCRRYGT